MIVLIDNGHGINTKGKCSPDGWLREYKWARSVAKALSKKLEARGIQTILVTPEDRDVTLMTRVDRVNKACKQYGSANCCLVSIHCNASPPNDGKWHLARGWSAYTSKGQTKGDALANSLYYAAETVLLNGHYAKTFPVGSKTSKLIRTDMTDGDKDIEDNFTILAKTNCAAVLTENMFQDNKTDADYLLSQTGIDEIVDLHFKGILNYINSFK